MDVWCEYLPWLIGHPFDTNLLALRTLLNIECNKLIPMNNTILFTSNFCGLKVCWRKEVQFSLLRESQENALIKQLSEFIVHNFTGRYVFYFIFLMSLLHKVLNYIVMIKCIKQFAGHDAGWSRPCRRVHQRRFQFCR